MRAICGENDVVLQPIKQAGEHVGLVLIQGAEILPNQYIPLAKEIQNASNYTMWIGIPKFTLDIPEPVEIAGRISNVLDEMRKAGMDTDKVFYAGHSLGGVIIQDYLNNDNNAIGQILLSSFLIHKYRNVTYPIPTLTLSGSLDGLSRVTRIMEEYYFRIMYPASSYSGVKNFPVVVIEGMNHFDVASGKPPSLVKKKDLRSEIAQADAHKIAAHIIVAFMEVQMDGYPESLAIINDAVMQTGKFLQPIITAYAYEAFYQFKPPCYSNPHSSACQLGSPWTEHAQPIMGNLQTAKLTDTDAFHPVYQSHFPLILNNCSAPTSSCVIKSTTVSQNVYLVEDKLDTGGFYTSAEEIRAKLKSRQAVMEAAGYTNVNFNTSDGGSICQVINQEAINWALGNVDATTLSRYVRYGVYMVVGEDKGPYNAGPLWIWNPLSYKTTQNSTGEDQMEVRSVMLRTPTDFFIQAIAGMHYCKLLSPARVTEWMYVDSLRTYYGIQG